MTQPEEVMTFWFGEGDDPWRVDDEIVSRWFGGGEEFDEEIRQRFGDDLQRAILGEYDDWAETTRGRMALILLLDQFSRHLFRGSPRSWTQDLFAQKLTLEGLEAGVDHELRPVERTFFYLPLEHAEDLQLQKLSVKMYARLVEDAPEDAGYVRSTLDYAEGHRRVIEQFGRFPHRNEVIGRPSTAEELAYLEESEGWL